MVKVKALISLVVGNNQEVKPGTVCEVDEAEAKRLFVLGFAQKVELAEEKPSKQSEQGKNNVKSNEKSG